MIIVWNEQDIRGIDPMPQKVDKCKIKGTEYLLIIYNKSNCT